MPDDRSRSESDASGTLAATICPYVKKENPPAEGTFEIGIVLAGAISAGAYSSGVVDFLIEALDARLGGCQGSGAQDGQAAK